MFTGNGEKVVSDAMYSERQIPPFDTQGTTCTFRQSCLYFDTSNLAVAKLFPYRDQVMQYLLIGTHDCMLRKAVSVYMSFCFCTAV